MARRREREKKYVPIMSATEKARISEADKAIRREVSQRDALWEIGDPVAGPGLIVGKSYQPSLPPIGFGRDPKTRALEKKEREILKEGWKIKEKEELKKEQKAFEKADFSKYKRPDPTDFYGNIVGAPVRPVEVKTTKGGREIIKPVPLPDAYEFSFERPIGHSPYSDSVPYSRTHRGPADPLEKCKELFGRIDIQRKAYFDIQKRCVTALINKVPAVETNKICGEAEELWRRNSFEEKVYNNQCRSIGATPLPVPPRYPTVQNPAGSLTPIKSGSVLTRLESLREMQKRRF
jgi:hypothetical protein